MKSNFYYSVLFFFFILHLSFITVYPVNLESVFLDASVYFHNKSSNIMLLEQFFYYQANTLVLPYIIGKVSFFLNLEPIITWRLVNLLCVLILLNSIQRLSYFLSIKINNFILILILLNPLIWIYSSRVTADFIPMVLAFFFITLFFSNKKFEYIFSIILFPISITLKYHAILFLIFPALVYFSNYKTHVSLKRLLLLFLNSFCVLLLFINFYNTKYGVWVTPEKFHNIHGIDLYKFINNLILYLGFFVFLISPLFFSSKLFFLNLKNRFIYIIPFFISCLIFYFLMADSGEMNFGPFDNIISKDFRIFLLTSCCFSYLFFLYNMSFLDQPYKNLRLLILFILVYIIIISISRPSQRYLIFLIPFGYIYMSHFFSISKINFILTLFLFACVNIYVDYFRIVNGEISKKSLDKVNELQILPYSNPGILESHIGNYFFPYISREKKYIFVPGIKKDSIFSISHGIGFLKKDISLVRINKK